MFWSNDVSNSAHFAPCFDDSYINKNSELMLKKRARAYSSSCSQVIVVYLHPFRCNSLFCSRKSQKNISKNSYFGVQGHLRSLMVIPLKSTLLVY